MLSGPLVVVPRTNSSSAGWPGDGPIVRRIWGKKELDVVGAYEMSKSFPCPIESPGWLCRIKRATGSAFAVAMEHRNSATRQAASVLRLRPAFHRSLLLLMVKSEPADILKRPLTIKVTGEPGSGEAPPAGVRVDRRVRRHTANSPDADRGGATTLSSKWSFARYLDRRSTFSKDSSQLVAKCGAVVMPMHRHSMMYGSLQKLFLTISRYRDRTIRFAWKFTTVYVFASHDDLRGFLNGCCCRLHQAPGRTQSYRSAVA